MKFMGISSLDPPGSLLFGKDRNNEEYTTIYLVGKCTNRAIRPEHKWCAKKGRKLFPKLSLRPSFLNRLGRGAVPTQLAGPLNSFTPPSLERLSHGKRITACDMRTLNCGKAWNGSGVSVGS